MLMTSSLFGAVAAKRMNGPYHSYARICNDVHDHQISECDAYAFKLMTVLLLLLLLLMMMMMVSLVAAASLMIISGISTKVQTTTTIITSLHSQDRGSECGGCL